ncbi:hypothetical protein CK203_022529 [Vitis vinifera]|uniref:Uncharacterized protein n=1 Tax=Vitis vinifera TaxID=29760 RepID=A0A438JEH4_VITVI|nr:hypothetical protein CK203_022529 [Vitis vinifera]
MVQSSTMLDGWKTYDRQGFCFYGLGNWLCELVAVADMRDGYGDVNENSSLAMVVDMVPRPTKVNSSLSFVALSFACIVTIPKQGCHLDLIQALSGACSVNHHEKLLLAKLRDRSILIFLKLASQLHHQTYLATTTNEASTDVIESYLKDKDGNSYNPSDTLGSFLRVSILHGHLCDMCDIFYVHYFALTPFHDSALSFSTEKLGVGSSTGYIDIWEHFGGDRHIDVDWSPIIEDLYSLELGSACVEVMTTLHGSAPSLRRRAEGCIPSEGSTLCSQSGFTILEALTSLRQEMGSQQRRSLIVQDETPYDLSPPPPPPPIPAVPQASPYLLMVILRRVSDGLAIWDDLERMPVASLPAKFRMPDIERTHHSYAPQQYRPRASHQTYDQVYLPPTLALPYYVVQGTERPPISYSATGHPCYATHFALSVTTNPLLVHTTHTVPPPVDDIHFLDFAELDNHIHMMSWDESEPEPIASYEIYEIGGVTLGPQMPTPFRLILEAASEVQTPYVDVSQTFDVQNILYWDRVLRQPPPTVARPLEGISTPEEARKEDDEILRQFQSTQARISIGACWHLQALTKMH